MCEYEPEATHDHRQLGHLDESSPHELHLIAAIIANFTDHYFGPSTIAHRYDIS